MDAESKLEACSGTQIPSGDIINDVSNASGLQSCGLFPHVVDGVRFVPPAQAWLQGSAQHGSRPHGVPCLCQPRIAACPDPTKVSSILLAPYCSCQNALFFFFLKGKKDCYQLFVIIPEMYFALATLANATAFYLVFQVLCFCPCSVGTLTALAQWRKVS